MSVVGDEGGSYRRINRGLFLELQAHYRIAGPWPSAKVDLIFDIILNMRREPEQRSRISLVYKSKAITKHGDSIQVVAVPGASSSASAPQTPRQLLYGKRVSPLEVAPITESGNREITKARQISRHPTGHPRQTIRSYQAAGE